MEEQFKYSVTLFSATLDPTQMVKVFIYFFTTRYTKYNINYNYKVNVIIKDRNHTYEDFLGFQTQHLQA